MKDLIGTVVPAGRDRPQWLFVVKVDGAALYGRTWLVKPQRWSKGLVPFGRAAIGAVTPKAPRPTPPQEKTGGEPPASASLQ